MTLALSNPLYFRFHRIPATKSVRNSSFRRPFFTFSPGSVSSTCKSFHYGPSLHKTPIFLPNDSEKPTLDRESFTQIYDLSALRVPADQCADLESRLRGHLLNWPRVRNVARVLGDDVDPETLKLLRKEESDGTGVGDSGNGGMLSPVLYREKLAKEFNCRGFLKFPNLAKMSRPKKKKENRVKEGEEGEGVVRRGKSAYAVVEVVENLVEEDDYPGLSGLVGEDGFGRRRWRGATRLLLLDQRYADKNVHELPQAVKTVLLGGVTEDNSSIFELVHCKLTLFYDYWQMNEILQALLPEKIIVPSAFETVGHIAHLNLKEEHFPYKSLIAQVVLDKNKQRIKTVVNKTDSIQNEYRTMELETLAGNHSLVTTVVENGIRFHVDLGKVYWNSRLSTERQRLIHSFSSNDVVCDVFAGVGPVAVFAAKKVKYVYANDLNPTAVDYLERNIVYNKLDRKIEVCNMDGRRFIRSLFSTQRRHSITQVVMNLPNDAADFLDAFRGAFKSAPRGDSFILPKIHVYGFSKSNNPEFDFSERIKLALCVTTVDIEMHRVRLVAPGKWMLCGSFVLPKSVVFGKR